MSCPGLQEVGQAVLNVMTEDQFAHCRRAESNRVVQHQGRWWEEKRRGLFQSIHWMARHTQQRVERPTPLCWGFRTTIHAEYRHFANSCLGVHLLDDVAHYQMDALEAKRRNQLRKCRKSCEIVHVTGPALLREQGYEVRRSVAERLGLWNAPAKAHYVANLDDYLRAPYRLVLAGISKGKLCGYLDGFAVDGSAYIDHVYIHSDALSTNAGTGLTFEFVQACRRSGAVYEVVYGVAPNHASLSVFKTGMGFREVKIPAYFWLCPPAGAIIRWWHAQGSFNRALDPLRNHWPWLKRAGGLQSPWLQ